MQSKIIFLKEQRKNDKFFHCTAGYHFWSARSKYLEIKAQQEIPKGETFLPRKALNIFNVKF